MEGIFSQLNMFELHEFLFDLPQQPRLLRRGMFERLDLADRLRYNDARLRYIESDFIVATPELNGAISTVNTVQKRNTHRSYGRYAVLIDGPSGAGKTTTLVAAGAHMAQQVERTDKPLVIGVEVPPRTSAKALLEEFCSRMVIEPPRRATIGQLMQLVTGNLNALGIRRVLVDEVQHLAYLNQGSIEATNTLKSLTNKVQATFVYAGVDVKSSALMAGPHGKQLARRTVREPLSTMTLATEDEQAEWHGIIRAFEEHMGLLDHTPGALGKESDYLFGRTSGSIGTLRNMLVDSAIGAIEQHSKALRIGAEGMTERIRRNDLDQARTDLGVDLFHERRSRPAA